MKDSLPILYVCRARDTARPWRVARAKDEARKLGWLPVDPLVLWDKDSGEEGLTLVRKTIAQVTDAVLVVGDEITKDMLTQFESHERFGWLQVTIYGTVPSEIVFPNRKKLAAPQFHAEWTSAARRVEDLKGWACATCRRFCGDGDHAERMARWCCVKEVPCDECGKMTVKNWSLCTGCRSVKEAERHEKRKKVPAPADMMLYSDSLNEWFDNEDDAWSHAADQVEMLLGRDPTGDEVREKLEEMLLLHSNPVRPRELELSDMASDLLPDDDCDRALDRLADEIGPQLEALNEAIEKSSPLSYTETDVAVDVAATWPSAKDPSPRTVSPVNAVGPDEGQEYGD